MCACVTPCWQPCHSTAFSKSDSRVGWFLTQIGPELTMFPMSSVRQRQDSWDTALLWQQHPASPGPLPQDVWSPLGEKALPASSQLVSCMQIYIPVTSSSPQQALSVLCCACRGQEYPANCKMFPLCLQLYKIFNSCIP